MENFEGFFRKLASWEARPAAPLVSPWKRSDRLAISADFRRAFRRICLEPMALRARSTSQSAGHRVAEAVASKLGSRLRRFKLEPCKGRGYPDKKLSHVRNRRAFALEIKATQRFNPRSGNRIVLTCASQKMRREFRKPVNHLLLTLCYRRSGSRFWVRSVRLDFLQPTTEVNIRLECSVNRRLLDKRGAIFAWIGDGQAEQRN
jgi:hypothetical protein